MGIFCSSVRRETSGDGRAAYADNDFFPWGAERTSETAVDFKFTGWEYDYSTGYNYAYNRFENKALGRFLSLDPVPGDISNPQSLNRYSYALNNPLLYVDPLGLDVEPGAGNCSASTCDFHHHQWDPEATGGDPSGNGTTCSTADGEEVPCSLLGLGTMGSVVACPPGEDCKTAFALLMLR